uniref:Phosphoinositide 3-kinase adapter protein 1 n=1 Tax=Latimeria chalumnae TaxID=7897 RepID=H3AKE2_LATCH
FFFSHYFVGAQSRCGVLVVHSNDALEWSQYLWNLFSSSKQFKHDRIMCYKIQDDTSIEGQDLDIFKESRCILLVLSGELVKTLSTSWVLESLQKALHPPHRVVVLLCGVTEHDDFSDLFKNYQLWKKISCDDEPDVYISTIKQTISEDSGCDSVTDTEDEANTESVYSTEIVADENPQTSPDPQGKITVIFPERIHCGEQRKIYIILKCKLDGNVKTEVEFASSSYPPVRQPATLENEYTIVADAPALPSGSVSVTVYSADLSVCTTAVTYYTDMEEIGNLLQSATNPVEFMCQAFKIVPYSIEALDKLLTESLKKNIPASGLHLFGINQLEEENMNTNQRDEELPTLLHFAAKYGLKSLTALLLTCPGALQAYSVANKHGDYPNSIAEKHGYKDLRQFIDEYVETVDMLKSHIKEELMQGEEDDSIYEPMANLSTDLLMKYSLNPGCDEELYESMINYNSQSSVDELYVDMLQHETPHQKIPDPPPSNAKESILRIFLEGNTGELPEQQTEEEDPYKFCEDNVYDVIEKDDFPHEILNRPPAPVPRPNLKPQAQENEPYIYKVFGAKEEKRQENLYVASGGIRKAAAVTPVRDSFQGSVYDPFAGMKTPGQRQLITLQEQVKLGIITVDEAVMQFKEWHMHQKRRSESFRFQQENLKRLRDSITRRQKEKEKGGKSSDLEITPPIRLPPEPILKAECGVYEASTKMMTVPPPRRDIVRRNWKTDSTSSTGS